MRTRPPRDSQQEVAPGVWRISLPLHPRGLFGWQVRRQCRKSGGHWWHPSDLMIEWKCCACGASRDGAPPDRSVRALREEAA